MNFFNLVILFGLLFNLNQGFVISNTKIQNNDQSCYLAWLNQDSDVQLLLSEIGTSFPVCPSSTTISRNTVSGLFCATNLQQTLDIILVDTTNYVVGVNNPPLQKTGFEKILDSSSGVNSVIMSYESSEEEQDLWCADNAAATVWELKSSTQNCFGVPLVSEKKTLCIYTDSECSIDGTCFLENLASSTNMYQVYPFFEGVFSAPNLTWDFVDL